MKMAKIVNFLKKEESTPTKVVKKEWLSLKKLGYEEVKGEKVSLDMPKNLFTAMMLWQAEHQSEISGYGVVDESGHVKKLYFTGRGTASSVTTTENTHLKVLQMMYEDGYQFLNLQWHSHYQSSLFWSSVDEKAQAENAEIRINQPSQWYIVYDQISFRVRYVDYEAKTYTTGIVIVDSQEMPGGRTYAVSKPITTYRMANPSPYTPMKPTYRGYYTDRDEVCQICGLPSMNGLVCEYCEEWHHYD